jgi:tetratricopeptide (TPR) repeat protein
MRQKNSPRFLLAAMLVFTTAIWVGCNQNSTQVASAAGDGAKIPVTTRSEEAKKEFLQGRNLSERLLGQESIEHFDKAIALDPDFATAELARANNSPTTKEFFEHEKKAVGLADKASDGERLMILANQAGTNGDAAKQKDYLEKLVAAYPNDERAQFNLAGFYFGQQEIDQAVEHYKKATELAPNYSPAYNVLGYAYRQQGDYASAEEAFRKYIALIPNDPNPYDSYAELLLKMGKFSDSIEQYHKALSIDPHFVPSHFGISADLMYMGKPDEATAELQKMVDQARNDGERRTAYFGMAVVAADHGSMEKALHAMDNEYAVAEKKHDVVSMAADLQAKGNILLANSKFDDATRQFDTSFKMVEGSDQSQEIKNNAELLHHFNLASVAIEKKDFAAAKTHTAEFQKKAENATNAAQKKQSHELAGRIALGEKDFDKAISEFEQSNEQDPRNLYRLSQAYQGKGDSTKAQEFLAKAAGFNSLPQLNYAFIRVKAQKMVHSKNG